MVSRIERGRAAEKLIKALLMLAAEPFRGTHDLDDLVARLLPVYH
jgi:hypothetical protein